MGGTVCLLYDKIAALARAVTGGSGKAEGFADGGRGETIGKLRLPLPPKPGRYFSVVHPTRPGWECGVQV